MAEPTRDQLIAAILAGRKALDDYSSFDSGMVSDDALETFVRAILKAALSTK